MATGPSWARSLLRSLAPNDLVGSSHLGSQFIKPFDEIFRTEDFKILKSPVRTPVANAIAERWIGSIRRELLYRTIIWNQHQLERVVIDYVEHCNSHRPHRSLEQRPPVHTPEAEPGPTQATIVRATRCDGLINEYRNTTRPATTQYSAPRGLTQPITPTQNRHADRALGATSRPQCSSIVTVP